MLLLACSALTLAALIYVFWITPEPVRVKSPAEREHEYLEEKRAVLYENLRDLHLEYRMGKLSDQDYQQMKGRYQEELAALLQALEHKAEPPPPPSPPGLPADLPAEARRPKAGAVAKAGRCPRCGKDNPPQNRFCGACGAKLPPPQVPA